MGIFLLIIGLLLFIGLVVLHEFGHFIMARRNGVEVEEFGIGFPPKAWSRKTKKGFIFSINWLPLGGFVRLKGEHDADTEPGTFGASSLWAKTKIMIAGVAMNLFAALVLLTILAWVGMPQLIEHQFTVKSDTKIVRQEILVGTVQPGSPAAKAGLQARDHLVAVSLPGEKTVPITQEATLPKVTQEFAGKTVQITYTRGGQTHQTNAQLLDDQAIAASLKTDNPKGHLGVSTASYTLQRSTWSAPVVAAGITKQFTVLTFKGLGTALSGVGSIISGAVTHNGMARSHGQTAAASQVSGPVGIFVVLHDGSLLGYQFMLMVIAIISLSLAIMNVLPIPALDGGKLFVTYISRLLGTRVSQQVEELVYGGSFVLLLLLVGLITIVDVKRFF